MYSKFAWYLTGKRDDLHARLQDLYPDVDTSYSILQYSNNHVNYTCITYEHFTYSIPDSRPKIAIFSPFEVKCTERGITHFPSLVSFQFLVHIDIKVPEQC